MGERVRKRVGGSMIGEAMVGAATPALFGSRREWARDLAVATAAGLFLGLIGPFGSYLNAPRTVVLAYWLGGLLFGAVLFGITLRPAIRLAPRLHLHPLVALALATPVTAIPLSLVCHAVALGLWPQPIGRIGAVSWYAQTLIIAAPFAIGHAVLNRPAKPAVPAPTAAPMDLLTRLPGHLGRDLVALQMEDHYVRVHTTHGSALVLMPLRQAIAGLGAMPGLQVHRSWWIARHAITGARQDGRNIRLLLSNGSEAPVSRANVAAVRQAGLL